MARLRAERGLTLEAAAHEAELHVRHWQKVEAAEVNITLTTLARLAVALGVDAVELLSRPDDWRS